MLRKGLKKPGNFSFPGVPNIVQQEEKPFPFLKR